MRILIAAILLAAASSQCSVCADHNAAEPALIILDPGHGGSDQGGPNQKGFPFVGAHGKRAYIAEDAYTYDVAKRIERLAAEKKWRSAFTVVAKDANEVSDVDEPVLLPPHRLMRYNMPRGKTPLHSKDGLRLRLAAAERAHKTIPHASPIWVSLHFDYAPPNSSGAKIYTGRKLCGHAFPMALAGAFEKDSLTFTVGNVTRNPINCRNGLLVLKEGKIVPRVLVELGNFKNPRDRALMLSSTGREQYASIIVEAIEFYLARQPGISEHPPFGHKKK